MKTVHFHICLWLSCKRFMNLPIMFSLQPLFVLTVLFNSIICCQGFYSRLVLHTAYTCQHKQNTPHSSPLMLTDINSMQHNNTTVMTLLLLRSTKLDARSIIQSFYQTLRSIHMNQNLLRKAETNNTLDEFKPLIDWIWTNIEN